jgi:hypothetical protein
MRMTNIAKLATAAVLTAGGLWSAGPATGNGGPFVVKYPSGDPAAKGVLARLDGDLKPARETILRVVKEDLTISFDQPQFSSKDLPPLAAVSAKYTIENPTAGEVSVDFGFPILRGIYMSPFSMMPTPDARVTVDGKYVQATIISNSVIYGIIRQQARATIDRGIASDTGLAKLVAVCRTAHGLTDPPAEAPTAPVAQQRAQRQAAPRQAAEPVANLPANAAAPAAAPAPVDPAAAALAGKALTEYLTGTLKWEARDAALLVEYASLDLGKPRTQPVDRPSHSYLWGSQKKDLQEVMYANLGTLAAIGEQKATQFLARLAERFDKKAGAGYEAIFQAWGGDVREQSVDLATGKRRPRELTLTDAEKANPIAAVRANPTDPTVYARVDYLNPNAKLTDAEAASCRNVLKNLPVVFTFAPMNLLHYQVTFPAGKTQVVEVAYRQYPCVDTAGGGSYQLAYVLHPASLWNSFGPIELRIRAPEGVRCVATVPLGSPTAAGEVKVRPYASPVGPAPAPGAAPARPAERIVRYVAHPATLNEPADKTGELLVAIDKADWQKLQAAPAAAAVAAAAPSAKPAVMPMANASPKGSAPIGAVAGK